MMKITSDAFANKTRIPAKYTCDGQDVIPLLSFHDVPSQAGSLALVVDDPDAPGGTWDHWVVWNIPPTVRMVAEGKAPAGVVGRNSWNKNSWGGPCPPRGEHRYVFKLFALDTTLQLPANAGKPELERAMKGHLIESCELVGLYQRSRS